MKKVKGKLSVTIVACVISQALSAAEKPLLLQPTEKACFERAYSEVHMKKHPKQTVQWISIEHPVSRSQTNYALIKAKFKGDRRVFSDGGSCWTDEKTGMLVCGIECDGGTYTLSERDDGKIAVRPSDSIRVTTCGDGDERPRRLIMKSDDQDTFVLDRMPDAKCDLKAID